LAQDAKSSAAKAALLEMAKTWLRQAVELDRTHANLRGCVLRFQPTNRIEPHLISQAQ
jgi:hypothetical protein